MEFQYQPTYWKRTNEWNETARPVLTGGWAVPTKKYSKDDPDLLEKDIELKKYGWETNMCYGTKIHLDAIKENGISKYHRKTFGICANYV